MRVLGVSNPNFTGVTIATKAVVDEYYPVSHQDRQGQAQAIGAQIAKYKPDLLVIGGWSRGYDLMLTEMRKTRNFPVICNYHSTLFHGSHFGDDIYWKAVEDAQRRGDIDLLSFVQPQTAQYYQEFRKEYALWLPHSFRHLARTRASAVFRIGILGGKANWYKNAEGAEKVAREYAAHSAGVEVISNYNYDQSHHLFLDKLASCSMLIHVSHLECYSNTVQEAWSRGIPVIMSSANVGLTKCPLLDPFEQRLLHRMTLYSGIDAYELSVMLRDVRQNWEYYANGVHELHANLSRRAERYRATLFKKVVEGYPRRNYDRAFFSLPFSSPDQLWV